HRDAALAGAEQRVIVFGVSNSDGVVRREAKLGEPRADTRSFIDAGWKDHHVVTIVDDLHFEAELADYFQHRGVMRQHGRNDGGTDENRRYARFAPRVDEFRRRRLTERTRFARGR